MRRALFIILLPVCAFAQALTPYPQAKPCGFADMGRGCSGSAMWILQGGPSAAQEGTGNPIVASNGATLSVSRASNVYCQDSSGVLHLLGNNTPCLEPNGLRKEGSATNGLLNNSGSGAAWTADGVTLTANATTGPDGASTATQLVTVAGGPVQHRAYQTFTATASTTYAVSVYAQYITNGAQFIGIGAASGTPYVAIFDVKNHVYSSGTNVVSGSPAVSGPYNGSWYRYSAAVTSGAGGGIFFSIQVGETTAAQANGTAYTATGGLGVYVAKFQEEQQAFASSPIDTTTTAVTRAADVLTIANPLSGSTYTAAATIQALEAGTFQAGQCYTPIAAGTANSANYWELEWTTGGGNQLQLSTDDATDTAKTFAHTDSVTATPLRYAATNAAGTVTLYKAGSSLGALTTTGTGTGVTTTQNGTLYIGDRSDNGCPLNGWLTNICVGTSPAVCTP